MPAIPASVFIRMIGRLTVLHRRKTAATEAAFGHGGVPLLSSDSGLLLDTCQRWLLVSHDPAPATAPPGLELFRGWEAYGFLLRVATGLASQLAGETNILGQMKAAWSDQAPELPWLQWLFADAKDIRARFLDGVGGASYGSLVRQLLRQMGGPTGDRVLLVGAGDMAETIGPWLRCWPTSVLNRTAGRAEALVEQLREQPGAPVSFVRPAQAEVAWRSAGAVVVCVPGDPVEDANRLSWLHSSIYGPAVPVIHLGLHRAQAGRWNSLPGFRCLDDIYALHSEADDRRHRQLALAQQACTDRALHRALGSSLSHPHGWEDLPAFFPLPFATKPLAMPDFRAPAMAEVLA
jgi:hypothetical protein